MCGTGLAGQGVDAKPPELDHEVAARAERAGSGSTLSRRTADGARRESTAVMGTWPGSQVAGGGMPHVHVRRMLRAHLDW